MNNERNEGARAGLLTAILIVLLIILALGAYGLFRNARVNNQTVQNQQYNQTPNNNKNTPPAIQNVQISIANSGYSKMELGITKGSTIQWMNNDTVNHTVTSDTGVFDSGEILPGQTFNYTFRQTGSFPYHDRDNPDFKGLVTVN